MKSSVFVLAVCAVSALSVTAAQASSAGEKIFAQKCTMCHQVKGKGGTMGPDLTKVSTKFKDADLKAKIENPKQSTPSSTMPAFKSLPKADMDALMAYMKTLK